MKTVLKIQELKTGSNQKVFKIIVLFLIVLMSSITIQAQWTQLGQTVEGKVGRDLLGLSVSISADGSIMAVGAPHEISTTTTYNGYVQVYRQNNGVWTQIGADIEGEAVGDYFGASVSLSADGSIIAIGAPYNDGNAVGSGHVRIFKNTNDVWTKIGADIDGGLSDDVINGVRLGDFSGISVSLSADGSIVAIGAPYNSDGNLNKSGKVRIYQNNNGSWLLIGSMQGNGEEHFLGQSVSLSADGLTVAIGAYGDNNAYAGIVTVFNFNNGVWTQIGTGIEGEGVDGYFGASLSLSADGSIFAAGGLREGARIYQNNNGIWTQIGQNLTVTNREGAGVRLNADGSRVAVSFSSIVIQYVYQKSTNQWARVGDFIPTGGSLDSNADGSMIVIGSSAASTNGVWSGNAKVYQNTTVLDTQELSKESIAIYPNPTSGVLNLKLTNNNTAQVFIYDVIGKVIYKHQFLIENNQLQIDMSSFNNGMYFVKIQEGNKILSTKIMKI